MESKFDDVFYDCRSDGEADVEAAHPIDIEAVYPTYIETGSASPSLSKAVRFLTTRSRSMHLRQAVPLPTDIEASTLPSKIVAPSLTSSIEAHTSPRNIKASSLSRAIEAEPLSRDIEHIKTTNLSRDIEAGTLPSNIKSDTLPRDIEAGIFSRDIETATLSRDIKTVPSFRDIEAGTLSSDIKTGTLPMDIEVGTLPRDIKATTSSTDIKAATLSTDIKTYSLPRDIEFAKFPRDIEACAFSRDIESANLSRNIKSYTVSKDIKSVTLSRDIETLTVPKGIESSPLHGDVESATLSRDIGPTFPAEPLPALYSNRVVNASSSDADELQPNEKDAWKIRETLERVAINAHQLLQNVGGKCNICGGIKQDSCASNTFCYPATLEISTRLYTDKDRVCGVPKNHQWSLHGEPVTLKLPIELSPYSGQVQVNVFQPCAGAGDRRGVGPAPVVGSMAGSSLRGAAVVAKAMMQRRSKRQDEKMPKCVRRVCWPDIKNARGQLGDFTFN